MSRVLGSLFVITGIAACAWFADDSSSFAQDSERGRRSFGDRIRFGGGMPFVPPQGAQTPAAESTEKKEEKPADGEKKPATEDDKKPKGPEPIKRPTRPMRPADPNELEVGPDDDGLVSFSFKGQPWPAVLEWLADISDMSLQWEEAPAGYLDLTTRGRYSVDEVRDLLNSVLLSKGFTLLRNGDVLIVANLKNLDASLVPRVPIEELDKRGNYELVKVFFDLDWLVAENAGEEIKPMLSPYGKATALKTTNRLDVMETASNLRRIRDLLREEQSDTGQQRLVREFRLRYTRASEVLETLQTLLGIEPKKASSEPIDPRAAMAMMMAQQQQQQGQGGQPGGAKKEKEAQVFLAVNTRENSILANAPPDKMAIIEQAINVVDVSQNREQSLLGNLPRMQVYRLSGVAPETLVNLLTELGSLDPTTRLEIDAKNRAIIAYAPLADHLLIRSLVDKLDGSGRRFEVIQLRMLSAEYVAGSIQTLMNGPEKTQPARSRYSSYYYDGGSSSSQEDNSDRFQVEADIEHNRLLLRANDVELAEIKSLLVKLGEIAPAGRNGHTTRVIQSAPGEDTEKLLRRLERVWPSVAPNPLEIENRDDSSEPPEMQDESGSRRQPSESEPEATHRRSGKTGKRSEARRDAGSKPETIAQPSRYRFAQDSRVKQEVQEEEASNIDGPAADAENKTTEAAIEEPATQPARKQRVEEPGAGDEDSSAAPQKDVGDEEKNSDSPEMENETETEIEADTRPAGEPVADKLPGAEPEPPLAPMLAPGHDLPRAAHAPIKITVGPYGLMISSPDTEALDRLEDLLVDITPARISYKVFTLRNTYAKDVAYLLEDVFKEDESKTKTDPFESLWYGYRSQPTEKARSTLGKRKPLKFIPDSVTNTILVQGADASQLSEIEDLIKLYDQREMPDSKSVRRTQLVELRYAKAPEVSDIVKDVYRDLLSPNDKALQKGMQPQGPQQQQQRDGGFYGAMFSYLSDDPEKAQNIPRFKGMLSVGIDERSNSLAISAPQILLTDVLEMVDKLDLAAKPTRPVVRVLKLSQPGAVEQIQRAFALKPNEAAAAQKPAESLQPEGPQRGPSQRRNGEQPGQN